MSDAQEIVFGQNPNQMHHAFRYIDALGLDRDEVTEAIRADLGPRLPLPVPPPTNAPVIGRVIVRSVHLIYHAYAVSEELVNVGSITRPQTRRPTQAA